jgi:hypothetical protein
MRHFEYGEVFKMAPQRGGARYWHAGHRQNLSRRRRESTRRRESKAALCGPAALLQLAPFANRAGRAFPSSLDG